MIRATSRLAPVLALLAVSACASPGDYPSLARRDVERINGSAVPVPAPEPGATAPAVPPADLATRLGQLVDQARAAHRRFLDRRPRAEHLAAAAGSAAVASEAWSVATVAIADLEAARSEAMVTLAELDALHAAHRVEHHSDDTADGAAIAAAREQVLVLVGEEDAVLAALRGRVRD
ncbi:MAG: hypothetical protein RIQ46_402 [Pseudomonadota bacterium]